MCGVVDEFNEGLILPTLIRQLKSILDQYPDDGQILKVSFLHICGYKDRAINTCNFLGLVNAVTVASLRLVNGQPNVRKHCENCFIF